jgi:hypothetical protein
MHSRVRAICPQCWECNVQGSIANEGVFYSYGGGGFSNDALGYLIVAAVVVAMCLVAWAIGSRTG